MSLPTLPARSSGEPRRSPDLTATADYILSVQEADGSVPWFDGGVVDPWDHVESAMGLTLAGHIDAARRAFDWLHSQQRSTGFWLAAYRGGAVVDGSRAETNFVAYCATGLWHHYLITEDSGFLKRHWPMLKRAMDFIVSMQSPEGEIYWALDTRRGISRDALITGCSSIACALQHAVSIAEVLGESSTSWQRCRTRLLDALRNKPDRFDRTWPSKQRFSMDWFYPVLTGVIDGPEAHAVIDARWETFIEPGFGCRCVSDQPWVTVAETCELVMALCRIGRKDKAASLFRDISQFQADDGSWWTGYALHDEVLWPNEKPTWTAAAVLLAADALVGSSAGAQIFLDSNLSA